MVKQVTDFFIYRWRYTLGYTIVGLILAELLVLATLYVPGGLSQAEMAQAVQSNAVSLNSFDPSSIINLPYLILQHAAFMLLGVTQLSIKLPSVIFGLASIAGMIILLRTWFRENVAILTTILAVTTSQFLFIAQSGTTGILYIFWPTWILVAAMMVSRNVGIRVIWKIVLFGLASLSLYTPLSVYILLALGSAVILHPHLRYIMKRLPKGKVLLAVFCALILIAPLIQALVMKLSLIYVLLGIPKSMPNFSETAGRIFDQYFSFAAPHSGVLMTPVFGLASMLLILLGVYRLFTTKYTARSYIISIWVILLIPILLINPMFVAISFVPAMLLMAMGVDVLFRRWYRLFPKNPYARVAGLIPLTVLIVSMVMPGIERYAFGYHYDPATAGNFSRDLRLLHETTNKATRSTVVATSEQAPFYNTVASHDHRIQVVVMPPKLPTGNDQVVVTHDAHERNDYGVPARIVTSARSQNANRFYVYK